MLKNDVSLIKVGFYDTVSLQTCHALIRGKKTVIVSLTNFPYLFYKLLLIAPITDKRNIKTE